MIPYFDQPVLRLGPLTIHAFGALAVIAIVAGRYMIVGRARELGVDAEVMWRGCMWAMLGGVSGGFAWDAIQGRLGIAAFGVLVGGLVGGATYWRLQGLSALETLRGIDILAYSVPFALVFGRLGCTLAHDHRGAYTASPLAVRFPEGSRYDLGLIEFVFSVVLAAAFFLLGRKPRPDGFFIAAFGLAYGIFRLWLEGLRLDGPRFFDGIGASSFGLFGLTALAVLLWRRPSRLSAITMEDA